MRHHYQPHSNTPVAECDVGDRSFDDNTLSCGAAVALACGRGESGGARESRSRAGHTETDIAAKSNLEIGH